MSSRRVVHGDELATFVWSPFPMMVDTDDGEVRPSGRGDEMLEDSGRTTKSHATLFSVVVPR